ncbi:branched-chain amino acid transport system permease protein [Thermomonospora echinospora]|uniref:Branched-chain amino acid transport system permease protein n=1 Tax=Thermomonospora echinospora TaxID=1992 RepID=A0A1H6E5G6_9ACTN|nr:branched-chain amino acid ABC transporter permease [Thermomonospora echinospora]SEG92940.1 branched-chain amino acid transport system permease protein [Thermomonospora echinospora]
MSVVAQAVVGTIVTGSVYGLVGVGFALLFRASKVLSFAQGGFMLLGAFVFYSLVTGGRPFLPAVLVTMITVAAFSAVVYVLIFARVAAREAFATSVATIGLAGVLQAAVGIRYGTAPLSLPDVVSTRAFRILGAVVQVADIVAVVMAVTVVAALVLILRHSQIGLRMNAVADNATLAVHLGISSARIATVAWALAGGTAALAGIAFSLRSAVDPVGVANIGLLAFPAIILGGLGSVGGALAGGLLLAGIQNAVRIGIGAGWVDFVSFALMLGFLFFRPSGLFGKAEVVRL